MSIQDDRRQRLAPERGRVSPRQLAHVVRRAARFGELVRWYSTVLGATEPVEQLTARPPLPSGMSPFDMLRF
jgi:hypothetical protein